MGCLHDVHTTLNGNPPLYLKVWHKHNHEWKSWLELNQLLLRGMGTGKGWTSYPKQEKSIFQSLICTSYRCNRLSFFRGVESDWTSRNLGMIITSNGGVIKPRLLISPVFTCHPVVRNSSNTFSLLPVHCLPQCVFLELWARECHIYIYICVCVWIKTCHSCRQTNPVAQIKLCFEWHKFRKFPTIRM